MADFETSLDGDTVDEIVWRRRKITKDLVEATFLINPGLAAYGPVLPAGVRVKLPDVAPNPVRNTKRIWS